MVTSIGFYKKCIFISEVVCNMPRILFSKPCLGDILANGIRIWYVFVPTGVCREFYRNDVSSFILLSSDSDYWGLISSLPEAEFLVVVEWDKCGQAIKRALETSEIYYCSLDDFCSGNIEEFKRAVLIGALKKRLPDLLIYNGKELARMLFEQARIEASDTEIMNFYRKYIRTITLKADLDGNFSLEVKS